MRSLFCLTPFLTFGLSFSAAAAVPPPSNTCADTIRVIRADYVDTLKVPDRAHPVPLATVSAGGTKIEILGFFPEIIIRQNTHIVLFGLLDDAGPVSKIYTKEPKYTMQIAAFGDKNVPCLLVRWEEAVQEGDGEAMYKVLQIWDLNHRVCLANERWAAAAGPAGSTLAGKLLVGCAAEISATGGTLTISEKVCQPDGAFKPRVPVRVDAAGTYVLTDGHFVRKPCK
jgi:hypothetical protein